MAKDELKKEKKSKKRKSEATEGESAEDKAARKAAKKAKKAAAAEEEASPVKKEKKSKKAKKEAKEEDESPKKKSKKEKKAKKEEVESEDEPAAAPVESASEEEEEEEKMVVKKGPQAGDAVANPTATTEVFMGNLSFNIDDDALKEAFKDCGTVTNIKWLEDRDTGKFKGCGFISFSSAEEAGAAVGMSGSEVLGREIKVDFAKGKAGGAGGAGGKQEVRPMQAKPEGCTTMFAGNLNFNIDDDAMKEFFKDCGEVSSIRWLTDRDSGDFKGCGFIEFADPDASLDKAAAKNGSDLMGRQIRLDFAAPRAPREKSW